MYGAKQFVSILGNVNVGGTASSRAVTLISKLVI
jgi:hypothetical protein